MRSLGQNPTEAELQDAINEAFSNNHNQYKDWPAISSTASLLRNMKATQQQGNYLSTPCRILRSGLRAASSTSYLDQVDVDGSGAVEWEEFCVLMYRKVQQACAVCCVLCVLCCVLCAVFSVLWAASQDASLASTSCTWIQSQANTISRVYNEA